MPACERASSTLHLKTMPPTSLKQVEAENIDYPTKRELVEILADLRKA